jgi:hypothetical protein
MIASSARESTDGGSAMQSIAEVLGMTERDDWNGNPPPPEESVDSQTAATFLRIHPKTLERKARMGQVPAMKLGKEWQYLLSLLGEWREGEMNSNLNRHRRSNNNYQKESKTQ